MLTQVRLVSYKNILKHYLYVFFRTSKKEIFLKTKISSKIRLNNLISYNKVFVNNNNCWWQRLHGHVKDVSRVNSSSNKLWFVELSLIGLGFRFSVRNAGSSFRLNVGYSHSVGLPLSFRLFVLKKKKRCLIFSSDYSALRKLVCQILKLRKTSRYKIKGLQVRGVVFKLKPGKRSK